MIKNIIFDLGNVLLEFQPEKYLKDKGLDDDNIEFIKKEIFLSEEWIHLDKGTLTREEANAIITKRNPDKSELLSVHMNDFCNMFKPIECNVEALRKLKEKKYNIFYLSNFHEEAFLTVYNQYEFFKCFDGGVVSAHVKMLKPEHNIYQELIKETNIIPEESLFIDDTEVNTDAAKELGFDVIHLPDPIKLSEKLKQKNLI